MGNFPLCRREVEGTYFIYDSSNKTSREVVDHINAHVGPYTAPWWYDRHMASLMHLGNPPELDYRREVLHHADGTEFSCDWHPAKIEKAVDGTEQRPVVIIAPALGGTSAHGYIRILVKQLMKKGGYVCCVLNVRGTTQSFKTKRPFHVVDCSDLSLLIDHVASAHPSSPLYAIGFSLGANFLSRHLMTKGADTPLLAALSVCNSFDYHKGLSVLEQSGSFGTAYSKGFASIFKKALLSPENRPVLEEHLDLKQVERTELMSDLDRLLCGPLYGYDDVDKYWEEASSVHRLRDISVPFLVLQALDDPVFADRVRDIVPLEHLSANPHVVYMETAEGGHFGFVEGDLLEAYSSRATYTYPARVASAFFSIVARSTPGARSGGADPKAAGSRKVEEPVGVSVPVPTSVEHSQERSVGSDGSDEREGRPPASAAADNTTAGSRLDKVMSTGERTAVEATGRKEGGKTGGETGGEVGLSKGDGVGQGQVAGREVTSD